MNSLRVGSRNLNLKSSKKFPLKYGNLCVSMAAGAWRRCLNSGSQSWLYTEITWGVLTTMDSWVPSPKILMLWVWDVTRASGFFKVLQVILMRSQVWELWLRIFWFPHGRCWDPEWASSEKPGAVGDESGSWLGADLAWLVNGGIRAEPVEVTPDQDSSEKW